MCTLRPEQISWSMVSPRACLDNRQVRRSKEQVPIPKEICPPPNNQRSKYKTITFLFFNLLVKHCYDAQDDLRNELLIKCRYELIGHTLFLGHWLLRYGLASPVDLFRAL